MPNIVFLGASPNGMPHLRLTREVHLVTLQKTLLHADDVELTPLLDIASWELPPVLDRVRPDILHFSGHGMVDALVAAGKNGEGEEIQSSDFALLLSVLGQKKPKCIVVNACFSQTLATQLLSVADAVVGMQEEVDDDAAVAFSYGFYESLMLGQSLEMALRMGRVRAKALTSYEVNPVLCLANGANAGAIHLSRKPQVLSRLCLRKDGSPTLSSNGERAWVEMLIKDAPSDVTDVIYDIPSEDYGSDDDAQTHKVRASTERRFYSDDFEVWGDITIRASLWGPKRGLCISSRLIEALMRYYDLHPDEQTPSVALVLSMIKGDKQSTDKVRELAKSYKEAAKKPSDQRQRR